MSSYDDDLKYCRAFQAVSQAKHDLDRARADLADAALPYRRALILSATESLVSWERSNPRAMRRVLDLSPEDFITHVSEAAKEEVFGPGDVTWFE